ncbi:RcpC/CpaB family pilus assembly protein [Vibrio breoganii]|uniref:Flp pilus assembly protein CpaB n=2 Tax=Vibrio breoganii TaxID=553239 RepID=A0AAP8MW10_9VIBR|nr:RcpC/CpaB family pilus assembly protein [Vibrio breoganii]OCH76338.1 Flp pilus assembly protein CpaB [Vibrio breoganii]PMG98933.1 Flp pilus assembly protein CpaB [Vibrio breoganii]PMK31793.1 Flp pilus assembly protein CpaB [Vibrio breoganii]PML54562.1 Flp pilus assembly protein CpaB [Vibrio breoganii]PML93195.1 Flp pilus assembly protein CpaB [Vibrio breoganii]
MNSRLIFILSFIFVAFGLFAVMQNVNARAEANAKKQVQAQVEEKKEVKFVLWRSKQELSRGEVVTNNKLERVVLPELEANALGVNSDVNVGLVQDSRANHNIPAGEYVFPEMFTSPDKAGYLDLLASEGTILYPLPISTINLINNYIRPGDMVDIISVSSPLTNLADTGARITQFQGVKARTIKRGVKVLAFEQKPVDPKEQQAQSGSTISARVSAQGNSKTTVIIEVEPEFVSKLSLAQRTMHLEIYRSQVTGEIPSANMSDVIENYQGIRELRGAETQTTNVEVY